MRAKVCLVVIFNHRFDRNLPALRALYAGRFSHVRFLVPFYRGADADVIPVYESSATFQGYLAQGWRHFEGGEFSHYVFAADDLLLNPALNEGNLLAELGLGEGDAYLKKLRPITDVTFRWPFLRSVMEASRFDHFVNAADELPGREEALARLAAHGARVTSFGLRTLRPGQGSWWQRTRGRLADAWLLYGWGGCRDIGYPLAMSFSDFFVVPAASLAECSHLCGVFAAMGIFVECALPTALALSARSLRLERGNRLRGIEVWADADRAAFEQRYDWHLPTLLANFPADALYVHPVKLGQWRQD